MNHLPARFLCTGPCTIHTEPLPDRMHGQNARSGERIFQPGHRCPFFRNPFFFGKQPGTKRIYAAGDFFEPFRNVVR